MRKRRVYLMLLILAVAGLVGLIAAGAFRERDGSEPVYKGRRLSEWVRVLPRNDDGRYQAVPAIRQIGTNAFPYCLKWIRYEQPTWKTKLYRTADPVVKSLNAHWELTDEKEARAAGAEEVLMGMGPIGAIPELSALLNDPKAPRGAIRAANVLAVGVGNAGLPPLLAALTNQQATGDLRWALAATIGEFGTNARAAVPTLQRLLTDPNTFVRACATNSLQKIDPTALERATR